MTDEPTLTDSLRDKLAAGTEGEWYEYDSTLHDGAGRFVAMFGVTVSRENRALIVAAVNSLPALLDVVEAATELDTAIDPDEYYIGYLELTRPAADLRDALSRLEAPQ